MTLSAKFRILLRRLKAAFNADALPSRSDDLRQTEDNA